MAVRKRTPAKRKTTTTRKKPISPAAQVRNRKAPPKTGVKKPTPKKTTARKTGLKKITLSPKNQKTAEKLYKMSDKKAAKFAAAPKKAVAKKTTTKTIKPKGRLSGLLVGGATLIGGLSALRNKPKTFGEAFKKARKSKGPNATFTYKGKKYSTVTKDQIKKAGYSNLRDYLNAQKKKK